MAKRLNLELASAVVVALIIGGASAVGVALVIGGGFYISQTDSQTDAVNEVTVSPEKQVTPVLINAVPTKIEQTEPLAIPVSSKEATPEVNTTKAIDIIKDEVQIEILDLEVIESQLEALPK